MDDFEVKIRSQWQGHPGTLESKWKLFNASNHIYINRKTWFGATLTPAILLPCARGSKIAYFGVKIRFQWQGYWNQSGYSLTPYIKSLLIGKHCLGHSIHLLYPCVHRGRVKIAYFRGGSPRQPWIVKKPPFLLLLCIQKKADILRSAFCEFFLVYFWPYIMIIGVLKWILHQKYPRFFFTIPHVH